MSVTTSPTQMIHRHPIDPLIPCMLLKLPGKVPRGTVGLISAGVHLKRTQQKGNGCDEYPRHRHASTGARPLSHCSSPARKHLLGVSNAQGAPGPGLCQDMLLRPADLLIAPQNSCFRSGVPSNHTPRGGERRVSYATLSAPNELARGLGGLGRKRLRSVGSVTFYFIISK